MKTLPHCLVSFAVLAGVSQACAQSSGEPVLTPGADTPALELSAGAARTDAELLIEISPAQSESVVEAAPENVAEPSAAGGLLQRTEELVFQALALLGVDYKYGGHSVETGFDCSGFVRHVFAEAVGMSLPHNASMMSRMGQRISRTQLKPGDLVFFNTLKRAFSHVGIYLGDNRFVHAPSRGGAVRVEDMTARYWIKRFNGARRMFDDLVHTDAQQGEGVAGR